jgi:imidazolonepropionase-like amidohydrolase
MTHLAKQKRDLLTAMRCARPFLALVLIATLVVAVAASSQGVSPSRVVAYEHGRWFNGSAFDNRTMYVEGGTFVSRPSRVDSVVDLAGGYVVPPFGEAHNHNIEPSARVDNVLRRYLQAGVFYVQNPNSLPHARRELTGKINRPDSGDVIFANGGLTGPGGHPVEIMRANIRRGMATPADGEGGFYYSVADRSALDRAWPALLATRPDIVKISLLYSEEYAARLADPNTAGWRGLDPVLVTDIVRRRRDAKPRIAAHVESAADFHVAVEAGVDQVAHIPGFRGDQNTALPSLSRYQIREEDARTAARKRIIVVTTLAGLAKYADQRGDAALRRAADQLNVANLSLLQRNGVRIAVGSDEYDDTSVGEGVYLSTLGVLDSAALLRSWSETTPLAIFPNRRLGRLTPGYEASFLVLAGDPLMDFTHVTRIRLAVKQGQQLMLQ